MSISLRILHEEQARPMRFSLDIPIHQVISEIREKMGFDGSDHGLFQPAVAGRNKARWFQETRSLRYYSLVQDVRTPVPITDQ